MEEIYIQSGSKVVLKPTQERTPGKNYSYIGKTPDGEQKVLEFTDKEDSEHQARMSEIQTRQQNLVARKDLSWIDDATSLAELKSGLKQFLVDNGLGKADGT